MGIKTFLIIFIVILTLISNFIYSVYAQRAIEENDCFELGGVYIVRYYNDRLCIDVSEALKVYE